MKIQMPTPTGTTHERVLFHSLRVGRYLAEVSRKPKDWDTLSKDQQNQHLKRVQVTLMEYSQVLDRLATAIYFCTAEVISDKPCDKAEVILTNLEAELGDEYLTVQI